MCIRDRTCCVFTVTPDGSSAAAVSQNCSYLQNTGFPTPYDAATDGTTIEYTVSKCDNGEAIGMYSAKGKIAKLT